MSAPGRDGRETAGGEGAVAYDLMRDVARALAETFTTRGHLAMRNEREGRGFCSHRRCSPSCIRQRERFDRVMAWLDANAPGRTVERPTQLALDEVAG